MKNLLLILCSLLFSLSGYAQGENNIWYFGDQAGLDFNKGEPVLLKDGQMKAFEGCATISDASGHLLFYTEGVNVWDRNHQKMPNGTGLLGDHSSTQAAVIVPKPKSSSTFYVFTNTGKNAQPSAPEGVFYSEIDMSLNNGLGDVTINKNIQLLTPSSEKLTAYQYAGCNEHWVLTHGMDNNNFYTFKVNENGVNPTPVISSIGDLETYSGVGDLRFSPDGKKLAVCHQDQMTAELFDFDLATGIVKNKIVLGSGSDELFYGAEFSPSGNILYLTSWNFPSYHLYQFDILAADIPNSKTTIAESTGSMSDPSFFGLQLGPNGKIYIAVAQDFLSAINNPDVLGPECNYVEKAISVGVSPATVLAGLPQFAQGLFNVIISASDNCSSSPTIFSLNGNKTIASAVWNFGDGNTSTEINPTHQYVTAGNYTVTVTATSSTCREITVSKTITVSSPPVITNPIVNQFFCYAEKLPYDLSQLNSQVLGNLSAEYSVAYFSSLEDAQKHQNILPYNQIITVGSTAFYAKVYSLSDPTCFATISFQLTVYPDLSLAMKDVYSICEGQSVTVTAPEGFSTYQWSDGSTDNETTITKTGSYSLKVTTDNGTVSCESTKNFTVYNSNAATISKIETKDWTDNQNTISIEVSGDGEYEFSIDGINYQANPVFNDLASGDYTVYVRDKKGCGVTTEEVFLLTYPKFFTPNGDGHNDTWEVEFSYIEPKMIIRIFDRYGKLLTVLSAQKNYWDGTYNGSPLSSSDYWFVAKRQNGKEYRGHFSLKR